jgi:hypothetical protein
MGSLESGDVLIRDGVYGYIVMDALSLRVLAGPYSSIDDAVLAARGWASSTCRIWRQYFDPLRGRAVGEPFQLELGPGSVV